MQRSRISAAERSLPFHVRPCLQRTVHGATACCSSRETTVVSSDRAAASAFWMKRTRRQRRALASRRGLSDLATAFCDLAQGASVAAEAAVAVWADVAG